jgi:hypothetical protein
MIITGGTGNGYALKVNEKNQAEVFADIRTEIAEVSLNEGQAFVVSTGFVNVTDLVNFSGLIYVKNTDTQGRNMFIEHIRVCGSCSCTNMEAIQCVVYRNPTTGTLISDQTAAYTSNNNYGSANAFNGLAYKGANSKTITNGDWFTQFVCHMPGHSIQDYNDSIVVPKNNTIAIAIKPTHEVDACIEINVHFK